MRSDWARRRRRMVDRYVQGRGVRDERVLWAMREVPRHLFVEEALRDRAYGEDPLPIGSGQTISRPYVVARMTELLAAPRDASVLEVGTGSGYQAAVLSRLVAEVRTVERIPELADRAEAILRRIGATNVEVRRSDGSAGWPGGGTFSHILVTAGAPRAPDELLEQLEEGGRLVAPVGPSGSQVLVRLERHEGRIHSEEIEPCEFVPLIAGA